MARITVKPARTIAELSAAAEIRCAVFADECHYLDPGAYPAGREVSGLDVLPTTVNFIGLVDGEPAATMRLLFPNRDVAKRCNIQRGFDIERALDLQRIDPDTKIVEISRACVLKAHRRTGILRHLFVAAYEETIGHGYTHWIGMANMETDCEADAAAVCRLLQARGYWLPDFGATLRTYSGPSTTPRLPLYSDAQRDRIMRGDCTGIALPSMTKLFATAVMARYFGVAHFNRQFRLFTMPLMIRMSEFTRSPYGAGRVSPEPVEQ
jgi:hypothetical protein